MIRERRTLWCMTASVSPLVPLPTVDAPNVPRNSLKVSTDDETLILQSRDRVSERLQEIQVRGSSHLSWPHDLMTSWTYDIMNLWLYNLMTSWPPGVLQSSWVIHHNTSQDLTEDLRGKWDFLFWWSIFSDLFLFRVHSVPLMTYFFSKRKTFNFNLVQILGFTPWKRNSLLFTDGKK